MIFMSQSAITIPTLQAEWSLWYVEHLRIMQTVNGIDSAVRFQTTASDWPPSLAMYSIRDALVFQDPYYQKIRGMGPWAELIDRRFYQRNLFEAAQGDPDIRAPIVSPDHTLLVTNQPEPMLEIAGVNYLWLKAVGLDCSTPYRGIAIIPKERASDLKKRADVAHYTPL
jgi:hypothetical protein